MKKAAVFFLILMISAGILCSCGKEDSLGYKDTAVSNEKDGIFEIALLAEEETTREGLSYQNMREDVAAYANRTGISYHYYWAEEESQEARKAIVEKAIKKGAKIVICTGSTYEEAVYFWQNEYPKVEFLLIDGEPHSDRGEYKIASNVHCILFENSIESISSMVMETGDGTEKEYSEMKERSDTVIEAIEEWYNNGGKWKSQRAGKTLRKELGISEEQKGEVT